MPDGLDNFNNINTDSKQDESVGLPENKRVAQSASDAESSTQPNYSTYENRQSLVSGEQSVSQQQLQGQVQSSSEALSTLISNRPDQTEKEEDEGKSQKTVLLLAILFFAFSLIGLGFYIFSGVVSGRFSFSLFPKKERSVGKTESSPALVKETPAPTSTLENSSYSDNVLSFEYPFGFSVTKEAGDLWLVKSEGSGEAILVMNPIAPQKVTAEDFLVSEVLKLDKKANKDSVKNLIVVKEIGDYVAYSYTLSDKSVILVFEDDATGRLVKILDFSYKMGEELENSIIETVVSTFSFASTVVSPLPTNTVAPSTTRFDTGE